MTIYERFVERSHFADYEDFHENFRFRIPEHFNFAYDVMDALAAEKPDKRALVYCNDKGEERIFTFADLKRESDKAAAFFLASGIRKGDKVLLILKRRYYFWFAILGLHKIGAVVIPATHLLTAKDLVYRNNAAGVKMIVCVTEGDVPVHVEDCRAESPTLETLVSVGEKRPGWLSFEEGLENAPAFVRPTGDQAAENTDDLLLYFTSGTSGFPKMVMHDHRYPLAHLLTAVYWHNVVDGGLHLTVSDTGWGKAVWGKLYGQWLAETAVMVYDYSDRFTPLDLIHVVEKYKVTTFCAPPTVYRFLIKQDLSQFDLSSLQYCTIAGEPLNPEVYHQFLSQTGLALHEGFGQTETALSVATYYWIDPRPGSMGKPSPLYDVDIVDEDGVSCPNGEIGEIVLRTDDPNKTVGLFKGYYLDEELTRERWHDGLYHTGDNAWRDEHGYYWFVGRADDIIKSSGYRIGPFEVESALMEHPAVMETAITGTPDPLRGQVVKATVVLAKGYTPSEELKKELQDHVKRTTAPYKYPRVIEFVDELPKTISGKIRRVQLREQQ